MRVVAWGNKIGLRPFEDPLTDAESARVYRWSRDEELLRWSGGSPTDLTLEEFRDQLRRERNRTPRERRAFFLVTREGELIGRVGCFAIDDRKKQGELGILIGERAYRGKGVGRDAVTTLLRYLFETTPLERINLFTYTENIRAQRCFAACGFRSLGVARHLSPEVGEFDGIEMEITRHEFLVPSILDRSFKVPLAQEEK